VCSALTLTRREEIIVECMETGKILVKRSALVIVGVEILAVVADTDSLLPT
jgi:hypothetical protein